MDDVINCIKDIKITIPSGATKDNGLKKLIEGLLRDFNEGFEFSKLEYFRNYIQTIDHPDVATEFI